MVTASQGINFVGTGTGANLIDHSIRSMFLHVMKRLQNGPIQCLGLWTGKFHLEEAWGLVLNIFLNRGCHWEECGNLSVFQGRRERLLYWLEGGKMYVRVRSPSH